VKTLKHPASMTQTPDCTTAAMPTMHVQHQPSATCSRHTLGWIGLVLTTWSWSTPLLLL